MSVDILSAYYLAFRHYLKQTCSNQGGQWAKVETRLKKSICKKQKHHLSCPKQKVSVSCNPRLDPTADRLTSPTHRENYSGC